MVFPRFQLFPDAVDLSYVPTFGAFFSMVLTSAGLVRGYRAERLARLALFGGFIGGVLGVGAVAIGLVVQ